VRRWGDCPAHSSDQVETRLDRAESAFKANRRRSFEARARRLETAADLLEDRAGEYGALMTREMGKPLDQAEAEAEKCAWVCRYYAEHGADFLSDELVDTGARKSYVAYEPLGPVLAIMPWNFPFWQLFRFGAPALMAGNSVLLKHAPNVPGCALAIEELFQDAGFTTTRFRRCWWTRRRWATCWRTGACGPRRSPAAWVPGRRWPGRPLPR
jgi:NAD-dependent aldehyde dehydrogenases